MRRRLAIPIALALALLVGASGALRSLVRLIDSMWLHELGHTLAAWLCGFAALPGPWRTAVPDQRAPLFALLLGAALALCAWRLWRGEHRRLAVLAGVVLALQLLCTLGVRAASARTFVVFAGDAGAMVLGAALAAGFHLVRSSLRWGLLALGALGLADPFTLWWRARHDFDVIPFGQIEGVGDSDPSVLVERQGWSVHGMVTAYVAVGVVCLIALLVWSIVAPRLEDE